MTAKVTTLPSNSKHMGAFMSDMTLMYVAARPGASRGEMPKFGLVAMVALALASAAIGLHHPEAITAEYQMAAIAGE
jgi:hypothetical protein